MKINKSLIISVLLVLVLMCVISTASAEDRINKNLTMSDTDELAIEEDTFQDTLEVSDSEEKLSTEHTVNNYDELNTAISNAADGDTIILNDGTYEFPSSGGTITLSKSLIFKGQTKNGVIITSPGTYSIFSSIDEFNLKIQNLNFNGVSTNGNGIVVIGGNGNLDVIDCSFENCKAKAGAIRFYGTGNCNIDGLSIINQKLDYYGATNYATALTLTGNTKYTLENILIDSANYTYSSSSTRGVIYINNGEAVLNNVVIMNCGGNMYGILNNNAITTVSNSKFLNNNIPGATGNAIIRNSKTLTINQTIISQNTVTNSNSGYIFQDAGSTSTKTILNLNYNNIVDNEVTTGIYYTTNTQYVESVTANYNYWGSNYDSASDVKTATNIDQTTWANKNGDTFVDQDGNSLTETIPTESSTPEAGEIYVSTTGNDENDGSTPDNAVQSIKHAIELANNAKGVIIIVAGEYSVDETLNITKELSIKCESGSVTISSPSSQLFNNTAGLSLENIKFTTTFNGNGAIIYNNANLNIDKCIFEVDGFDTNAIYVDGGDVVIQNSILLNPTGYALTKSESASTITANNNWWGNNTSPNTNADVTSWIVMNASIDLERINQNDEVTITVSFEKTNGGSDYTETLPEFNVTVTASNLNENLTVKNNKASVKYTVTSDDEAIITSASQSINVPLKLYVAPDIIYVNTTGSDTNDGDEAHPVKTIAQAIALAQKGKIIILEGTYTLDNTLTVDKDLDITGVGNVIVNGSEKRFLSNNANLNITNIKFTNGKDNGAALLNNANLTLTNVSIYSSINSAGSGASVIRNNKKLTVINSKFYDNEALRGNIHNEKGELRVINSEFYNNKFTQNANAATGYGIYNYQGNVTIENSLFRQNDGSAPLIYSNTDPNSLTIINCTFEDNNMSRFGAVVAQNTNALIINSTFKNNYANKTSTNSGEGGAIYISNGNVSIENSQFINNKADSGRDIYVYSGELNIFESILINKNGYSIEKTDSALVTANDNWWGANTPNTPVTVDRWIIMTVTCNDSDIRAGDEINITVSFDKTNSSEGIADYTGNLGDLEVNLAPSTTKTTVNKIAEFTYTVGADDKNITITSSNASEVLKVHKVLDIIYVSTEGSDDHDGNYLTPVKTLAKAIELAEKGVIIIQEGTYPTSNLGIISNDLNITGNRSVILDAGNNNRILYIHNTSNIVLKNIKMINGYTTSSSDESGAILGNSGNLTLINCTLANSKSEKNAGAIYNAGNLVVINSIFENNTADKCGGAIFTQNAGIGITPSLIVENSIFKNNTAGGNSKFAGGAIFAQEASSVSISNSIFENNKALQYGGGAVEIVNTQTASVDKSSFINNTANGEDYDQKSDYGGGAISFIGSYGDLKEVLTVTNSLFIDNSISKMGGGAIYTRYAKVNVSSSLLIGNSDVNNISIYRRSTDLNTAVITANDNWWATNDNPKANINGGTLSSWIILTVSNASEIKEGENVNITVSLNTKTDGSQNSSLTSPLSFERPVTIMTNKENITGTLTNGEFKTEYTVPSGLKYISASVDNVEVVLYVLTSETNLQIENITALMGDRITYTVNVTSDETVNKGNVEVYFNNTLIKTIPVSNSQASDTIIINKQTGVYDILVKYTDSTKEFGDKNASAILNVTGIDNIVTSENFNKFFDNGVLMSDIPFDEIYFEGSFDNLGVLTINKTIKITGINASLNDTVFKIIHDNVSINNFTITLSKNYADSDNACIYIGADNAVISKNNITYNAPDNVESYVIIVDIALNTSIIDNEIKYTAKSEGDVKTIAVDVYKSNNFKFENNILIAEIPSVAISYVYPYTYFSQALHIENTDVILIKNNTITANYSSSEGSYDTIYLIHATSSNNTSISDNKIKFDGKTYAYAIVADGKNIIVSNNEINVTSTDNYACGININSDSTGVIKDNTIQATSIQVVYPIYLDDWYSTNPSELNITGNSIYGNSTNVYAVYIQANKSTISNNNIVAEGNFTMGITAYDTDIIVSNNTIISIGSNVGVPLSPQSSVPNETTGICAAKGSVDIHDNKIISTGANAVDAIETEGKIINNNLTAGDVKGDDAVKNNASNLEIDNNASSGIENETPSEPVYKLTADNLKMYYSDGTQFKSRVTVDGKALSQASVKVRIAGKTYTIKSDKNGYVYVKITNLPGKYTAVVQFNNLKVQKTITVLQSLTSKNVKVKKSAKKLVLTATLKNGKKTLIGKKITFKFNGKTYKAKTNAKGIAKVTIKKNVIKKLKAGKKYKVKITYLKDTIQKTVKVKK